MLDEELPLLGIDQNDHIDFVELQITATGVAERTHDLAISFAQVSVELLERIIDRSVEDCLAAMRQECARRRNCHLWHGAGRRHRLEITEMIDHRVAGERTEPRGRPMRQGLRLTALKAFDVRRRKGLHVVEMTEKIAAPETAPVFTIGHHFQTERRLLGNSAADRFVLDCFQIVCADLARSRLARASLISCGRSRLPT